MRGAGSEWNGLGGRKESRKEGGKEEKRSLAQKGKQGKIQSDSEVLLYKRRQTYLCWPFPARSILKMVRNRVSDLLVRARIAIWADIHSMESTRCQGINRLLSMYGSCSGQAHIRRERPFTDLSHGNRRHLLKHGSPSNDMYSTVPRV